MSAAIGDPDQVARRLSQALAPSGAPDDGGPALVGSDANGTVCVDVPVLRWQEVLTAARDQLGLDLFDWLSAVDEPGAQPPGVDVVAHLVCSTSGNAGAAGLVRLMLRTRVPGPDLVLASVTSLWPAAAWHERETHEMFGVQFTGFDDGTGKGLRPLLLPDGFEGTPLRKSFVLAARVSKPWPGAKEPGESDATTTPARRKMQPPGVPDPSWGPRDV